MKKIVLIRHGESLGQTARIRGINRKKDPSLLDCFLSTKGIHQACALKTEMDNLHSQHNFDLIVVSPLTRAIATCVLCLGHLSISNKEEEEEDSDEQLQHVLPVPIICHPHIAETGGKIPENMGRPTTHVIKTVRNNLNCISPSYKAVESIDFSLLPETWPNYEGGVHYFLEWLHDRPECNIAIVCHYNIIKRLLAYCIESVRNCEPIQCYMVDGDVQKLHLSTATITNNNDQTFCNTKKSSKNR